MSTRGNHALAGVKGWPTIYFDHCGRRTYMKQLAAETGIPLMTLYQRWHRGDRDERLVRPHIPRIFSRNPLEQTHADSTHR